MKNERNQKYKQFLDFLDCQDSDESLKTNIFLIQSSCSNSIFSKKTEMEEVKIVVT